MVLDNKVDDERGHKDNEVDKILLLVRERAKRENKSHGGDTPDKKQHKHQEHGIVHGHHSFQFLNTGAEAFSSSY